MLSHKRKYLFALLLLFLVIPCFFAPTTWLAMAWKQRLAANKIIKAGGSVRYSYELDEAGHAKDLGLDIEPNSPTLLRWLFGNDSVVVKDGFNKIVKVDCTDLSLIDSLSNIRFLTIQSDCSDDDFIRIRKLQSLEKLEIYCPNITDAGLINLRYLSNLRSLVIWVGKVNGSGLKELKGLNNLIELGLPIAEPSSSFITDEGLASLESLTQLQTLCLNKNVSDNGLIHIRNLTKLKYLYLLDSKITNNGLQHLQGMVELKELSLSGDDINDVGIKYLSRFIHLEYLSLNETKLTNTGLEYLNRLPQIKCLVLSHTSITDDGLKHLQNMKQLESLRLDNTLISDDGLEYLLQLNKLKYLILIGTHVTKDGVAKVKKALPKCAVITDLRSGDAESLGKKDKADAQESEDKGNKTKGL